MPELPWADVVRLTREALAEPPDHRALRERMIQRGMESRMALSRRLKDELKDEALRFLLMSRHLTSRAEILRCWETPPGPMMLRKIDG